MTHFMGLWLLCLVVALAGCGQREPAQQQLVGDGSGAYPELRDSLDERFREDLAGALRDAVPELVERLVAERRAGLVVADISDLRRPLVASFDGDRMNYAASLPKLAILYAAFVEIDRGTLTLNATLEDQLTRMIRNSSNEAATAVYERVGPERIAEILQAPPHRLYDPDNGGGLWVGKGYGGDAWRRDPVAGISHGASAMQVARFYYLLVTGQLVSPESTTAMMEILSAPAIRHKFVIGLANSNPDARLYRKSGTWQQFHADSALVVDPGYRYIAVAIVEDEAGEAILEELIGATDKAVARRH
jgi:beta-lactamase class A